VSIQDRDKQRRAADTALAERDLQRRERFSLSGSRVIIAARRYLDKTRTIASSEKSLAKIRTGDFPRLIAPPARASREAAGLSRKRTRPDR